MTGKNSGFSSASPPETLKNPVATLDIRSRQNRRRRPGGRSATASGRQASLLRAHAILTRLRRGNVRSIPAAAESAKIQRYREVVWLKFLEAYRTFWLMPTEDILAMIQSLRTPMHQLPRPQ